MQSLVVLASLISELAGGQNDPLSPKRYKNTLVLQGLICPIRKTRSTFWKAENRQAIDGYDDSECNSRILGEWEHSTKNV